MKTVLVTIALLLVAGTAGAVVKMEPVEYKVGDTTLRGQIAYDDAVKGKRPGVIVVHEWWGLNEYAKARATMLAEKGYVAFAVDMFGEGKTTTHPEEAGAWATAIRQNAALGAERFNAALDVFKKNPRVDAAHIAAIGYCFGGGTVLGMALAGADLDGVVSFHGGLPQDAPTGKVTASILVCHGAADSFIPTKDVDTFVKNVTDAGADWQFISYAGARHGFTNPKAGDFGLPGLAYNEKADKRSWETTLNFLAEVTK